MTEYQVFIGLATIICSGVVSAIVTYKLNLRKDERQLLRQKLEDLNLAVIRFCTQLGIHYIPYTAAMTGKITFNEAMDSASNSKNDERNYDKLAMLVNIYFPQLTAHLESIHKVRDMATHNMHDFKRHYQTEGTASPTHLRQMQHIMGLLGKAEADFKAALHDEAISIKRFSF